VGRQQTEAGGNGRGNRRSDGRLQGLVNSPWPASPKARRKCCGDWRRNAPRRQRRNLRAWRSADLCGRGLAGGGRDEQPMKTRKPPKPKTRPAPKLDNNRRMPWPPDYARVEPRFGVGPLSDVCPPWLASKKAAER
jgi:hypothetical protein